MGARELLADLSGMGLRLSLDGGNLVVRPAHRLTDDMRQTLREHKPEVLAELRAMSARECRACTHYSRRKTCMEPVGAGLAEHFCIRWPEPEQARVCAVFNPKERR